MTKYTLLLLTLWFVNPLVAQIVEIESADKGMILPRVTSTLAVSTPVQGMIVYQTDPPEGLYKYDGTSWSPVGGGTGSQPQLFTAFSPLLAANAVRYGIFGQNNSQVMGQAEYYMTQAGTIDDFCVHISNTIAVGSVCTMTLMRNGNPTTLAVTYTSVDAALITKCDTGPILYEVGDRITVKFEETSNTNPTLTYFTVSMNFLSN